MRILLIVVAMIVVTIVAIVAIGALLPRRHVATKTAVVQASPEQVFRLISGPQDWRTDLKEYEIFDEGGHHMVRETDKHGQTITYEVVQSQAPVTLKRTIADKSLPFGGSWTWNIRSHGESTSEVTITEDGEVYNPVFRFVSRFIMGHTKTIDSYFAMLTEAAKGSQASATATSR